jgi:hypothetical protein
LRAAIASDGVSVIAGLDRRAHGAVATDRRRAQREGDRHQLAGANLDALLLTGDHQLAGASVDAQEHGASP